MREKDYKEGFTIVEVALVLAIAGLIFLMAFIAVPAVQRTQRDARRRDDVGTLLTAIQKYQNNNRGALPSNNGIVIGGEEASSEEGVPEWVYLYKSFLGSNFMDPIGFYYNLRILDCGGAIGQQCSSVSSVSDSTFGEGDGAYTMYVVRSATCDGSTAIGSGNPRKVAVVYKMEGAGAYCANLQ